MSDIINLELPGDELIEWYTELLKHTHLPIPLAGGGRRLDSTMNFGINEKMEFLALLECFKRGQFAVDKHIVNHSMESAIKSGDILEVSYSFKLKIK